MVQPLTSRLRLSYDTNSNRRKISKTPGDTLVYLYTKKPGSVLKYGGCKLKLRGITLARPRELSAPSEHVWSWIIRAFLIKEQTIVAMLRKSKRCEEPKKVLKVS
ncbi:hypothetical protein HPB47_028162 [Ixodes persulcatus]|uniref:Uncharacterized protein n=1 Tax=Ixodes persulcatus TaxID=34615 RepID=A0AC60PU14_IXOPE|nr:hypothetical protein HPB47_028162 [Ixodes persulcatus]